MNAQRLAVSDADSWEADFLKEVHFPGIELGECSPENIVRHCFTLAGYRVSSIREEKVHPVMVVRLVQNSSVKFVNNRELVRHCREILRRAGFHLRPGELSASQSGPRILVAFQTGEPVMEVDRILSESAEKL